MIQKLKKFIPLLVLGFFVLHTVAWYGISFYFENRLEKLLTDLANQGIQVSYSMPHTTGYPARFQHHFYDVRFKMKNQWICTVPVLSVQANFLFPFTKQLKLHLEGMTILRTQDSAYKVALTNLHGILSLAPCSLQLSTHALSLLAGDVPFGEGKKTFLRFEKKGTDQVRLRFASQMILWFTNPLAPTLPLNLTFDFRLEPGRFLWNHSFPSNNQAVLLHLDDFKFQMIGTTLSGTGTLTKFPEVPWGGDLNLRLQGLTQFSRFLKDFAGVRVEPLIDFIRHFNRALKKDIDGGFDLVCQIKEGHLRFKEIPFLSIPLFGETTVF